LLLVLLAPLMAALALFVSLDGGPVLYRHQRVGQRGRAFDCLKFRTMILGADQCLAEYLQLSPEAASEWQREHKLRMDPRVTGIGRILRESSLDELPQLFNVLRGEMSLVGPRPVTAAELKERYGSSASICLSVPPGITGLWQVSGRTTTGYERRVQLDRQYVSNWSLLKDLEILVRTLRVVLRKDGAH
jgi:lipopolysaccharide/colanic/teichoic acid biosynthesis glycosyltransferase